MNEKIVFIITVVVVLVSAVSGCLEIFQDIPTKYESHPIKISYNIKYGYNINCTGIGKYEIKYICDIPENLKTISYSLLYNLDYELIPSVNNSAISWNISGIDNATYELGVTASIESESFLVSGLNGEDALTIQEINSFYPEMVQKYCHEQSNRATTFIDPTDPDIKTIARGVLNQAKVNNSFIIAKSLFTWLKENTNYQIHDGQGDVQPAAVTLQKKTGDCDDLSYLYISLCRAVGIPARFIRGYLVQEEENGIVTATAHAWAEVFVGALIGNKGWVPVECACCASSIQADINQNFGVEDAFHLRLFVDDGSNESLNISLSGIHVQYYENINIELHSFAEIDDYLELESKQLVVTKENTRYYQ
ncbi:MAG: transglutaminase domain-containing protein [Thermoplasmatales archaeon]|nr:MAG: transglutaminase domain-containing protein [Thermoplasmatales archaeon]